MLYDNARIRAYEHIYARRKTYMLSPTQTYTCNVSRICSKKSHVYVCFITYILYSQPHIRELCHVYALLISTYTC